MEITSIIPSTVLVEGPLSESGASYGYFTIFYFWSLHQFLAIVAEEMRSFASCFQPPWVSTGSDVTIWAWCNTRLVRVNTGDLSSGNHFPHDTVNLQLSRIFSWTSNPDLCLSGLASLTTLYQFTILRWGDAGRLLSNGYLCMAVMAFWCEPLSRIARIQCLYALLIKNDFQTRNYLIWEAVLRWKTIYFDNTLKAMEPDNDNWRWLLSKVWWMANPPLGQWTFNYTEPSWISGSSKDEM